MIKISVKEKKSLNIIIGMSIYSNIKLGKAFGKSTGFIVGLVLLNTIFTLILGFGDSEYQLEKNA